MSSYVSFGCCPNSSEPLVRRTLSFSHTLNPPKLDFESSRFGVASHSLNALPDLTEAASSFNPELLHKDRTIQQKLLTQSDDSFASSRESFSKREKSMTPINSLGEESNLLSQELYEFLPFDLEKSPKYDQPLQSSPQIPIPAGGSLILCDEQSNILSSEESEKYSKKSSSNSDGRLFSFDDSEEMKFLLGAQRRASFDYITPLRLDPSDNSIKGEDET